MASAPGSMVITRSAQCRPLWLAYLLKAPVPLLLAMVALSIFSSLDPELWPQRLKAAPPMLLVGAVLLPFALWRNRFTFDKEAGLLTHAWGYPFRWLGTREYALSSFSGVSITGVRPYWTTPKGPRTPLFVDGFRNDGRRLYYQVILDGAQSVMVGELHTFAAAIRERRRLAMFLGFAVEPVPKPQAFLGAYAHLLLVIAVMPLGMLAGLGLFLLTFKPLSAALAAVGLKEVQVLFYIASFGFWPLLSIATLVGLVSLTPAACPCCGGKARLTWTDALAPGLGVGRYRCGACPADWPANG